MDSTQIWVQGLAIDRIRAVKRHSWWLKLSMGYCLQVGAHGRRRRRQKALVRLEQCLHAVRQWTKHSGAGRTSHAWSRHTAVSPPPPLGRSNMLLVSHITQGAPTGLGHSYKQSQWSNRECKYFHAYMNLKNRTLVLARKIGDVSSWLESMSIVDFA